MSIKYLVDLCKELNHFKYTYLVDGKQVPKDKVPKLEDYCTMTLHTIKKYHIGLCWDITNYGYDILTKEGYTAETYFIEQEDGRDKKKNWCHTFTVVYIDDVVVLFEPTYNPMLGIHVYTSLTDLIDDFIHKSVADEKYAYTIYRYNCVGKDNSVAYDDFIKRVKEENRIILRQEEQ